MDEVLLVRELNDVAPDDVYVMDTSLQSSVAVAGKSIRTLEVTQFTVCDISRAHSMTGLVVSAMTRKYFVK